MKIYTVFRITESSVCENCNVSHPSGIFDTKDKAIAWANSLLETACLVDRGARNVEIYENIVNSPWFEELDIEYFKKGDGKAWMVKEVKE
jgi:hypothetical protein